MLKLAHLLSPPVLGAELLAAALALLAVVLALLPSAACVTTSYVKQMTYQDVRRHLQTSRRDGPGDPCQQQGRPVPARA